MFQILWLLTRWAFFLLIAFIIYNVYYLWVKPMLIRKGYKKYNNLSMIENFIPFVGDLLVFKKDVDAGNVFYDHMRRDTEYTKKYDLKLEFVGYRKVFKVISAKAHQEFDALCPSKIDRFSVKENFGRLAEGSLGGIRTNANYLTRRKRIMELLGVNSISSYIPDIAKSMEKVIRIINENQTDSEAVIISQYLSKYVNIFFTRLMFGEDENQFPEYFDYIDASGEVKKIPMEKIVHCLFKDGIS